MTTKKKRTHNYPDNRKPRDTSYAESTQLLKKHDKQWIKTLWKSQGPKKAAERLNTSPGIIRYIATQEGWTRWADHTPNIVKGIQRGKIDPDDLITLKSSYAMEALDPDKNSENRYAREANCNATWDYRDPRKPTSYRQLPYLDEKELPCIRKEIVFADKSAFLVVEALPDLSEGYWYLNTLPERVIYHDLFLYNYRWDHYMEGSLIPEEVQMIKDFADHFEVSSRQGIQFFSDIIDPAINKLNRRIKEALKRKMDEKQFKDSP